MEVRVVLLKDDKRKLKPHSVGKRDIKELAMQMEFYVKFLKEKKGVKVISKS